MRCFIYRIRRKETFKLSIKVKNWHAYKTAQVFLAINLSEILFDFETSEVFYCPKSKNYIDSYDWSDINPSFEVFYCFTAVV